MISFFSRISQVDRDQNSHYYVLGGCNSFNVWLQVNSNLTEPPLIFRQVAEAQYVNDLQMHGRNFPTHSSILQAFTSNRSSENSHISKCASTAMQHDTTIG